MMDDKAFEHNGFYLPGESPLHRVDPRLKLLVCSFLVILAFSVTEWSQLLVMFLAGLLFNVNSGPVRRSAVQNCWKFRWLLLFTLLLHLFLSPGHTLWGSRWLSLDGLILGSQVCLQILIAVFVASLLGLTTSPGDLARSLGWVLSPLKWVGCRVDHWQRTIFLVLQFVPILQGEFRDVSSQEGSGGDTFKTGWRGRLDRWTEMLRTLLDRLLDRADDMAHRSVAGEEIMPPSRPIPTLWPLSFVDMLFIGYSAAIVLSVCALGGF